MSEIKLKLSLKVPQPSIKDSIKKERPIDIFIEKVYDYIIACESPIIDSEKEWCYLKCLYKKLTEKPKLNPELKPVLKKLEDLFVKQAGRESVPLDSARMNRWEDLEASEGEQDND